jgi:asparagine synthetase B (glutamine-hydrolysing)
MLRLYLKYAPDRMELLQGMFAFAIMHDDEIFPGCNPRGIKPLYCGKEDLSFLEPER